MSKDGLLTRDFNAAEAVKAAEDAILGRLSYSDGIKKNKAKKKTREERRFRK